MDLRDTFSTWTLVAHFILKLSDVRTAYLQGIHVSQCHICHTIPPRSDIPQGQDPAWEYFRFERLAGHGIGRPSCCIRLLSQLPSASVVDEDTHLCCGQVWLLFLVVHQQPRLPSSVIGEMFCPLRNHVPQLQVTGPTSTQLTSTYERAFNCSTAVYFLLHIYYKC